MALKRRGRRTKLTGESLLHFPLAPLGGFDPKILFQDKEHRETDEFILVLAHVFNDLKASMIISGVNAEFRPPPPAKGNVCKFFGQNFGIDHYAFRLQVGIVVELIELIRNKKHLFDSQPWKELMRTLPPRPKRGWIQLLTLVNDTSAKASFTKRLHTFLVKVRSHGGYHYYQTGPFANGYIQHFQGKGPEAAYAYVSMGKTFEETRFFFADAAVTAITEGWKRQLGKKFDDEFARYLRASHTAIRSIICGYLKFRKMEYQQFED